MDQCEFLHKLDVLNPGSEKNIIFQWNSQDERESEKISVNWIFNTAGERWDLMFTPLWMILIQLWRFYLFKVRNNVMHNELSECNNQHVR